MYSFEWNKVFTLSSAKWGKKACGGRKERRLGLRLPRLTRRSEFVVAFSLLVLDRDQQRDLLGSVSNSFILSNNWCRCNDYIVCGNLQLVLYKSEREKAQA